MQAGDRCPQCKQGLIERTELGFECDTCAWNQDVAAHEREAARARVQVGAYKFRPFAVRIRVESPEEGEVLLQGCIVARSNNNSPHFQSMIDAINQQLEPWRAERLRVELEARNA
jgi:hypothetical protein